MKNQVVKMENIGKFIYLIRGERVMLDSDLAMLYGVETSALNRAIRRNTNRFPEDFAFQATQDEWKLLICQIGISKKGRGGRRRLPIAFTEQGVAMLSSVLRSPQAVAVNIEIIRTFVQMRHAFLAHKELNKEMREVKSFLLKHSSSTDREFKKVWKTIEEISKTPEDKEPQRKIGFKLK